jgi:hypothetical protein
MSNKILQITSDLFYFEHFFLGNCLSNYQFITHLIKTWIPSQANLLTLTSAIFPDPLTGFVKLNEIFITGGSSGILEKDTACLGKLVQVITLRVVLGKTLLIRTLSGRKHLVTSTENEG